MPKSIRNARRAAALAMCSALLIAIPAASRAETLPGALAAAYRNNPQLNAQRAQVRVTDEAVPQALSGYRPQISATADIGSSYTEFNTTQGNLTGTRTPRGAGITATQNVFNGYRTANRTRAAEGQVLAAREALRVMEQQILLDAATAYMNVLRDTAILDLQRRNVEVLEEQLRQTRDRFNVGEVTRTDVAQSEVALGGIAFGRTRCAVEPVNVARCLSPRHRHRAGSSGAGHAGGSSLAAHARRLGQSRYQ